MEVVEYHNMNDSHKESFLPTVNATDINRTILFPSQVALEHFSTVENGEEDKNSDQIPDYYTDELNSKEAFVNNLVLSLVERYVNETSAKGNKISTNESVDTDENVISEGEGQEEDFVTKINEYLENLVQSEDEGIHQMFSGEGYCAETKRAIQDEVRINESSNEMDTSVFLDDNEDTFSEDEMGKNIICEVGGDNQVDGTANEVGTAQTSGLEISFLKDGIETNENAAEKNLPIIIEKRNGKEKVYAILSQVPWEVTYLSMYDDLIWITEMQTNVITGEKKNIISARNPSLFGTVSKKAKKKAATKNVDAIKSVYVTQKDGNILYKVVEKDVVMCEMKTNEEDTLRESVQSREMSISKILCVEINKKTGTRKLKRFKEFILARKDGYEKVYNISHSKNKRSKKNKKKPKKYIRKTKKNQIPMKKKRKIKNHKKESTKKIAHRTVKRNLQISLSETCETEAKDERVKENLPTVLGLMNTKENNACYKEQLCKCRKPLPSNEEEAAISYLVEYFVEEQISNVCFDFHRAAKFEYFCAREDIKKDDENYASKKKICSWLGKSSRPLDPISYLGYLATQTGEADRPRGAKAVINYKEGRQQTQGKKEVLQAQEKVKVELTPREPTCPPMIKKLSVLKQVLQDLENKELLPKTKIPVDVFSEEKGSTDRKLSKKKDTMTKEKTLPNHKKIASSPPENSKGQVKKNKVESKKKMRGSNQGEASFSPLKKKRKVKEEDKVSEKDEVLDFEGYQRCLEEEDEIAKQELKELQIKIEKDRAAYRTTTTTYLLEQKKGIGKEEKHSGCFSEIIEKANKKQKSKESNKTDEEGITKNKKIDKTLLENIGKREQKRESKKRKKEGKSSEKNKKVTMEGENEVFVYKSENMKGMETTYLLSTKKNATKNKNKCKIVSEQEPVLRKRKESTNSDNSSNQELLEKKRKLKDIKTKIEELKKEIKESEKLARNHGGGFQGHNPPQDRYYGKISSCAPAEKNEEQSKKKSKSGPVNRSKGDSKKKKEEKSNTLGETEEIFKNNYQQKRKYDSTSEDGSEEQDFRARKKKGGRK